MFVADVKCSQATWQTVPNSQTCSAKASVSKAVVHTWHRTHVIRERPKGSSVAFGDEMDIISQVRRHLTAQLPGAMLHSRQLYHVKSLKSELRNFSLPVGPVGSGSNENNLARHFAVEFQIIFVCADSMFQVDKQTD